jgi:hypothetical protein
MELVSLIVSAVGVLPLLTWAVYTSQRLGRAHRLIRFARSAPVDVVLTTSAVVEHDVGVVVSRPVTGYGQVAGLTSCIGMLARFYRRKSLRVHLSGFVRNRIESDLVCLGGPVRNDISRGVLDALASELEEPRIEFDDVTCAVRVKDARGEFTAAGFDPGVQDGAPANDLALVILTNRRPNADGTFRAILCAGFTTYGTAAAAEYAFSDLPKLGRRGVRALTGAPRIGWTGEFVIVLRAQFSRGECIEVRAEYGAPLRRRKRRP